MASMIMTRTPTKYPYVLLDYQGRAVIEGSRSRVSMIVQDAVTMTPREIHEAYPHLSLAAIYSALSYYEDHKAEVDAEIAEADRYAEAARAADHDPERTARLLEKARA